jgi:AMMECR1 domain-containing protein
MSHNLAVQLDDPTVVEHRRIIKQWIVRSNVLPGSLAEKRVDQIDYLDVVLSKAGPGSVHWNSF